MSDVWVVDERVAGGKGEAYGVRERDLEVPEFANDCLLLSRVHV